MTNIGPLTTNFAPAATCATDGVYNIPFSTLTQSYYYVQGPISFGNCYPSGYNPSGAYYSPGVCPSGYTVACSQQLVAGSTTETVQTCCPSFSDRAYGCLATPRSSFPWEATLGCVSAIASAAAGGGQSSVPFSRLTYVTGTQTLTLTNPTGVFGAIGAYSIQVRFQSTDFQPSTLPRPGTTPTASGGSAQTAGSSSSDPTVVANSSGGSISGGAAAGIAIAAAAAVAILIGIFWFMRRRKRQQTMPAELNGTNYGQYQHQQQPQQQQYQQYQPYQHQQYTETKPSPENHMELPTPYHPAELGPSPGVGPGQHHVAEMGDYRQQ